MALRNQPHDRSQLEIFAKVGGLAGLALFVVFALYSRFFDLKPLLGKVNPEDTFRLIYTVLVLTFGIAVLGLLCWLFAKKSHGGDTRDVLLLLFGAFVVAAVVWSTTDRTKQKIDQEEAQRKGTEPGASSPGKKSGSSGGEDTPGIITPAAPGKRILVASNLGLSVGGCESRGQTFSVPVSGTIDDTQGGAGGAPRGFDLEITGNNGHGVRNIVLNGKAISFEAYADGPGTKNFGQCFGAQGANVAVNVFAYVRP